jgi:hypothetical protein
VAQEWLYNVSKGRDPSRERHSKRQAPTVTDVCKRFLEEYSSHRNKDGIGTGTSGGSILLGSLLSQPNYYSAPTYYAPRPIASANGESLPLFQ